MRKQYWHQAVFDSVWGWLMNNQACALSGAQRFYYTGIAVNTYMGHASWDFPFLSNELNISFVN